MKVSVDASECRCRFVDAGENMAVTLAIILGVCVE